MANSTEDILKKSGDKFIRDIRDQFDRKNLNDTDRAKNSIESKVNNNVLKIIGLLRTVVLIDGRRPGSFPPIDVIMKWAVRKLGIPEEEARGVAFAISKKIAEKGTDIFTDQGKGLQLNLIIEDLNNELFNEVSDQSALQITNTIVDAYES